VKACVSAVRMRHKQDPQAGEDEAQVVADCGEDGVRGVKIARGLKTDSRSAA
jgi:hypothetical protein